MAHDDFAGARRGQKLDEALRLGACEGAIEGLHHQLLHPRSGEELPLARARADQRRGVLRREHARRMRLERERADRPGELAGRDLRRVEQSPMSEVHSVEVPDRQRSPRQPPCGARDPLVDAHPRA